MKRFNHNKGREKGITMAKKPTMKAVRECFIGVPTYLYYVRKDDSTGKVIVTINDAIHKHWYAMEKFLATFEAVKDNPLSDTYTVLGYKKER